MVGEDMMSTGIANAAGLAKNRFLQSLPHARTLQEDRLRECLRENEDTVFGREHGFERIFESRSYRNAVPIRTYDDLGPWLQRVLDGEPSILTALPPRVFLRSTGTTAEPKKIPMTQRRVEEIRDNLLFRVAAEIDACPDIVHRTDCCLSLTRAPRPFVEFAPSGIPIHPLTGLPTRLDAPPVAHWTAPWWTPPSDLRDAERLYFYVRSTVEADLRLLRCLHPSRFQAVSSILATRATELVRDVHDGTPFGSVPNPRRARELDLLMKRDGVLTPRAAWPEIRALFCWTGGHAASFLDTVRAEFGAPIRPTDISSTEVGAMTRPVDAGDGVLSVDKCFWEFVPAEETMTASSDTCLCDEVEIGKDYIGIATTPWGLYRYNTQDVFRVTGMMHRVPRLAFVARVATTDLTGEKLTEHQLLAGLAATWKELGAQPRAYACVPCPGRPARYALLVEWAETRAERAGAELDAQLKRVNHRYALQRANGELGEAAVEVVPSGGFARYRETLVEAGAVAEQMKDRVLQPDDRMRRFFRSLGREEGTTGRREDGKV